MCIRDSVRVVYPCVDTGGGGEGGGGDEDKEEEGRGGVLWRGKKVVLSINRFERKKDVGLAVRAFAGLGGEGREGVRLVIAGMLFAAGERYCGTLLILRQAVTIIGYKKTSPTTMSWCPWRNL